MAPEPPRRMSRTCGSRSATIAPCTARRCAAYPKPVATSARSSGTGSPPARALSARVAPPLRLAPGLRAVGTDRLSVAPRTVSAQRGERLAERRDLDDSGHALAVDLHAYG